MAGVCIPHQRITQGFSPPTELGARRITEDYFFTVTPASTFAAPTSSLFALALACESFDSFGFAGTFQKPGVGTMNSIPTCVLPIKLWPTLVTRHNNSSLTLGFSMRMI